MHFTTLIVTALLGASVSASTNSESAYIASITRGIESGAGTMNPTQYAKSLETAYLSEAEAEVKSLSKMAATATGSYAAMLTVEYKSLKAAIATAKAEISADNANPTFLNTGFGGGHPKTTEGLGGLGASTTASASPSPGSSSSSKPGSSFLNAAAPGSSIPVAAGALAMGIAMVGLALL